ncbi:hypothetical protein SAMN05444722_1727 [Rhodovulum sp. ES.010]|uniref:hypothetical protein n=1 Tax=Rhodovulum sp. ES.010 TaxID=1882821 RepID=UPI0009272D8F|nr:hypothetical protein [Rhodovulum sp. ES.010]SIO37153.1 hypothetical protein SAMN05444722_1727 [Rhodovulum sp. ES.010]
MPDRADDLSIDFQSAGAAVGAFTDALSRYERRSAVENGRRVGRDRSWIAKTIIGTYGVAVIGMGAYVALSMPLCGSAGQVCDPLQAWQSQAKLLFDLVVTAVVPVVTLMLGFYFGTESSQSNQVN